MATLLITAAGAAFGGAFGAFGAVVGQAVGGLVGAAVDQTLFGSDPRPIGRLSDLTVQSSTEGAPIPRVYGRFRIAGEVIWATRFEESVDDGGGKSLASTRTYRYAANFAVGICEGPIARIGRVWANGELLDTTRILMRVHTGSESQEPDSLIRAKQGEGNAPAYRGLAYVVFEQLPLDDYGNTLPQLTFEVIRPVGRLESMIRAVTLIPGSTEFGYAPQEIRQEPEEGVHRAENRHATTAASDVMAALDELQAVCPNLDSVALVVAWFGDDLRADHCQVRPKVEANDKVTTGAAWRVSGVTRASAATVSRVGDAVAYGGTPADQSVIDLIRELNRRGLKVTFYPFIMMDIPDGNGLPDPYGGAEQPVHPWRGRITCHPAPGRFGSPDGSGFAASAVAAFAGTCEAADITVSGDSIGYGGPAEWSLRRMILHYARLCAVAGGVDSFLIGSELRGLTTVRGAGRSHPFVEHLVTLANDVKAMVGGGTKVSYAADWSEYFGHRPEHLTGEVAFHLDPLWASSSIDFVGIDAYLPLADWRDGDHADRALAASTYDLDYLAGNVAGGELYDWYYASDADRRAGVRSPITDGAAGKPWVFRPKDLIGWWDNRHYDRIAGEEVATPTAWLAGMKPIRFTEIGCPAVDRGANQPNVFLDPRSSESAAPYFSRAGRDDGIQRRALEAMIGHFDPDWPRYRAGSNPLSALDGRRMVEHHASHVWTWDARPYPWFPLATDVWSDGPNWITGHWLNGRLGSAPLCEVVEDLCRAAGAGPVDAGGLSAVVEGLAITDRSSPRAVLAPLMQAFRFTAAEAGDGLVVRDRDGRPAASFVADDLAVEEGDDGDAPPWSLRRAQDEDLPSDVTIGFLNAAADGLATTVTAQRGGKRNSLDIGLSVQVDPGVMQGVVDACLKDLVAGRETVSFAVAPTALVAEAGDVVTVAVGGRDLTLLLERVEDGPTRRMEGRVVDPDWTAPARRSVWRATTGGASPAIGRPAVMLFDLPSRSLADADAHRPYAAVRSNPWPGALAVHLDQGGFTAVGTIRAATVWGRTETDLPAGPVWRFDRGSTVTVKLHAGRLSSVGDGSLLAGRNLAAIGHPPDDFELVQFGDAELIDARTYRLSTLLRGQFGTEHRAGVTLPAGAHFVLIDRRLTAIDMEADLIGGDLELRIGPASRDIGDETMRDVSYQPTGLGLMPFAPVRLTATRLAGGDVALAWIRRTRRGGDNFQASKVPLAEAAEAYEVAIRVGGAVARTLAVTSPSALYTAADQIADHGSLPSVLDIAVAQVSEILGPGRALRNTLDV